ncbi:MAG: hypothetical protein LUG93_13530 [Lachnospiraceae bacterium]|nr:hypothetical protein [Lachnospiraceae bacterium]MCD7956737.1 hypothetical protein [Lachnospiraceae bacterium]
MVLTLDGSLTSGDTLVLAVSSVSVGIQSCGKHGDSRIIICRKMDLKYTCFALPYVTIIGAYSEDTWRQRRLYLTSA